MVPNLTSTFSPSACAPDSAMAAASSRMNTGWTSMVKGPSAGAVMPTETSAVNRISVPSSARTILVRSGTSADRRSPCQKGTVRARRFPKENQPRERAGRRSVRMWDGVVPPSRYRASAWQAPPSRYRASARQAPPSRYRASARQAPPSRYRASAWQAPPSRYRASARQAPPSRPTTIRRNPRRPRSDLLEKYFAVFAASAVPSGPWIASETVAETRSDLNLDHGTADHLVAALQVKHHAVDAHAEDVFDGEAALDLGLAGLVRRAVGRRLRLGAVAPFPFDGVAVELFVVVGPAGQLGRQHDARRRHRDDRRRLQRELGLRIGGVFLILVLSVFLRREARRQHGRHEQRRRAGPRCSPQVPHDCYLTR